MALTVFLANHDAAAPSPWSWLWWTGMVIPVFLGIASLVASVTATVIATNASHRDRDERHRVARRRAVLEAEALIQQNVAQIEDLRFDPGALIVGLRTRALREGVEPKTLQPLVNWIAETSEELRQNVDTHAIPQPGSTAWRRGTARAAYDVVLSEQLGRWSETGTVDRSATVGSYIAANLGAA